MQDTDRRISTRKPLRIGVTLVVDGLRTPGTLRDLSMAGAGFSDPVLTVQLNLDIGQLVILEIPGESREEKAMRLPGEVVHAKIGLSPRMGIRFRSMEPELSQRLLERLGRVNPGTSPSGEARQTNAPHKKLDFVLIEPRKDERKGRAVLTMAVLGAIIIASFVYLLLQLSNITL